MVGGKPDIDFYWKDVGGKRRLIGNPNMPMRNLHRLFYQQILCAIKSIGDEGYGIRKLPSATGCVKKSNPTMNARRHIKGKYFYVTDLRNAYPSVDLRRLATLLVFLGSYKEFADTVSVKFFMEDDNKDSIRNSPMFREMLAFLKCNFSGIRGRGLAVGGPLSPYLMNLYCEVYLDARVRRWCLERNITYTRYVDDITFSSTVPISEDKRREIRRFVYDAGFEVNHRKSRVYALSQGTIFITKVGLEKQEGTTVARLVFPQRKRRRLHNAIHEYLNMQRDWPEYVSGLIGEFLYYYKQVPEKTASDKKTFALCKAFETEWAKYSKYVNRSYARS